MVAPISIAADRSNRIGGDWGGVQRYMESGQSYDSLHYLKRMKARNIALQSLLQLENEPASLKNRSTQKRLVVRLVELKFLGAILIFTIKKERSARAALGPRVDGKAFGALKGDLVPPRAKLRVCPNKLSTSKSAADLLEMQNVGVAADKFGGGKELLKAYIAAKALDPGMLGVRDDESCRERGSNVAIKGNDVGDVTPVPS
jgi:hypothetical protein